MFEIIPREDAKAFGLMYFFTSKPCKNGHIDVRYVSNTHCCECARERSRKRYSENPEKLRKSVREYQQANSIQERERKRNYRAKNSEKVREKNRRYCLNNPEKVKEFAHRWRKNNQEKVNAFSAKNRASKLQRTPTWITKDQINEMKEYYKEAKRLEKLTAIKFHVDHIIPLQGKNVSGLHVPWNLQILTAHENLSKNNKLLGQ